MERRKTKAVKVGNVYIGSDYPISVQSMLCTKNSDPDAALQQTASLIDAGCDIVRLAVIDEDSLRCIKMLKREFDVPLVADIQFNYRLALRSIEAGIDKVRINPGNIGDKNKVAAVISEAKKAGIPIRVGVNTGSISDDIRKQYGVTAKGLCEEAMRHVRILEDNNFSDIVISLKASSVPVMIESYKMIAEMTDYPLHLGVTEAGTSFDGIIKSSIGIGALLSEGIGDTIRVSLTADPKEEVIAAKSILSALDLSKRRGARLVSCPTCARCSINLISLAEDVSEMLKNVDKDIKVAVMGCVVNGPGEAKDADIGVTGAGGEGIIFAHGEIIKRVPESEIKEALFEEIARL